ncbi:MAG: hypothetical protein NTV07_05695 [Candidatus Omnitrophica bacterium]|nr:hypothetical protein [Candidatus Omnitrophota bacterium]
MRKRHMWVPIISFGGLKHFNQYTGKNYTVKDVATNPQKQFEVVTFMQDTLRLDVVFTMMELSCTPEAVSRANRVVGALPIESVFQEKHVDQKGVLFGPGFEFTKENIAKLRYPDINRYDLDIEQHGRSHVFIETMAKLWRKYRNTKVGKIGYAIGPFTLAARLLGEEEATLTMQDDPETFGKFMEYCTEVSIRQACALAEAGADAVIILDPSTALQTPAYYRDNIVIPVNKISAALHEKSVAVIFHGCGDSTPFLEQMTGLNVDAFSIDEVVDMRRAYDVLTKNGAYLIGNIMASQLAQKTPAQLAEETRSILREFGDKPNFVLGITCEMPYDTPILSILAITDAVITHAMEQLDGQPDAEDSIMSSVLRPQSVEELVCVSN